MLCLWYCIVLTLINVQQSNEKQRNYDKKPPNTSFRVQSRKAIVFITITQFSFSIIMCWDTIATMADGSLPWPSLSRTKRERLLWLTGVMQRYVAVNVCLTKILQPKTDPRSCKHFGKLADFHWCIWASVAILLCWSLEASSITPESLWPKRRTKSC